MPDGPISILGLGGGTAARLLSAHYPDCLVHGWDHDPHVLMAGNGNVFRYLADFA